VQAVAKQSLSNVTMFLRVCAGPKDNQNQFLPANQQCFLSSNGLVFIFPFIHAAQCVTLTNTINPSPSSDATAASCETSGYDESVFPLRPIYLMIVVEATVPILSVEVSDNACTDLVITSINSTFQYLFCRLPAGAATMRIVARTVQGIPQYLVYLMQHRY